VFASKEGDVVGPVRSGERGVVVAKVTKLQLVDPERFASEKEQLRARLSRERSGQMLDSILNERRRDTVLAINTEFVEQFVPEG
jgi:hypothetical protein